MAFLRSVINCKYCSFVFFSKTHIIGIITKGQLEGIIESKLGYGNLQGELYQARKYSQSHYTSSIFLSHSHVDATYVHNAVLFLRKMGVDVYVDWMDDNMPKHTSGETARLLKEKIKSNDKFVFLATNNSINSKWCHWEIGYGDAFKYIDKIALFPLADSGGNWQGTEYLQIYPFIKASDYTSDFYKVAFPDGKEISLYDWLKR